MKNKFIVFSFLFFSFYARSAEHIHHHHHHQQNDSKPNPIKGESIYNLKSNWTNQNDEKIELSKFRCNPVVLALIYTSCKSVCPLIVADIKKIERRFTDSTVKFVLVSFDPETDSPKALKQYGNAHALDLSKWTLLNGTPLEVRELAAILDVRYKKLGPADFEHSNIVTVLDREGVVKFQQTGLNVDPQTAVEALDKIVKDKSTCAQPPSKK